MQRRATENFGEETVTKIFAKKIDSTQSDFSSLNCIVEDRE